MGSRGPRREKEREREIYIYIYIYIIERQTGRETERESTVRERLGFGKTDTKKRRGCQFV